MTDRRPDPSRRPSDLPSDSPSDLPGGSLVAQTSDLPWRETPYAGVQWKKLRYDPASGASAVMLRFEPGARYGAHRHPGGEEYYVLEGVLQDGSRSYGAGSYVYHPPGSVHAPRSDEGCLLYVTLPRPIDPVEDAAGKDTA